MPSAVGFFHGADAPDEVCKALCGGLILSINKGKGESVLPDICKNYVIYYVVLDHRIMEVRRFFYNFEKKAEKTVYISMGTVNQNKEFYRNCIRALGNTDYQVILSMGTNTDHFDAVPDNIEIYESVDQMAVLDIADAFITHCGMNSASEGLYFGVPLVLFPQTSEQDAVTGRAESKHCPLPYRHSSVLTSSSGI